MHRLQGGWGHLQLLFGATGGLPRGLRLGCCTHVRMIIYNQGHGCRTYTDALGGTMMDTSFLSCVCTVS